MTRQDFEALVARHELQARQNPGAYRRRVALLALFGYGYLAAVLIVLLALLVGTIASIAVLKAMAIKLALPVGGFAWLVLQAMWVRIQAPRGYEVRRDEAPELFEALDALSGKLESPRFHTVLVTDDFNAAVVQLPRLGVFGWYRNYLLLGLPLLKTLTKAQFVAVLAHELGHLSGGHGRFGNWIYRQRLAWARLQDALEHSRHWGSFVFRPFIERFVPYFNAFSFPLARANEFEADAVAARLTSPQATAAALTGVNVIGIWLNTRYWPRVHAQADCQPQPQPGLAPYAGLCLDFCDGLPLDDAQAWINQAMTEETTVDDTHPSLSDRLQALGETPIWAPPVPGDAADRLLGEALERVTVAIDESWQFDIQPSWRERYDYVQRSRCRLTELQSLMDLTSDPSPDQAYEHALLDEAFGAGPDAALEALRSLNERSPENPQFCYALGVRLLSRDDESGVALLERTLLLDGTATEAVAEALRDYYRRIGEREIASKWHERLLEGQELERNVRAERDQLLIRDRFDPHGLSQDALAAMLGQLRPIAGLRHVYLVRKRVHYRPERPCLVLGFCVTPWWRWHSAKRAEEVQKAIMQAVDFPEETFVLNVEGDNYRFRRKLRRSRGSRIL